MIAQSQIALQQVSVIFFWFVRMAVVVFVLIPGSIPAAIVGLVDLLLSYIDPNGVISGFLVSAYNSTLGALPTPFEYLVYLVTIAAVLSLIISQIRKKAGGRSLFSFASLKLSEVYVKYIKFPRL